MVFHPLLVWFLQDSTLDSIRFPGQVAETIAPWDDFQTLSTSHTWYDMELRSVGEVWKAFQAFDPYTSSKLGLLASWYLCFFSREGQDQVMTMYCSALEAPRLSSMATKPANFFGKTSTSVKVAWVSLKPFVFQRFWSKSVFPYLEQRSGWNFNVHLK